MITPVERQLAGGKPSAVALVEGCLREIDARDSQIRAFLEVDGPSALQQARASDRRKDKGQALGPLDGLPVAVKANLSVKGFTWSGGMAARSGETAHRDAAAVAALRSAGAVIVGTTNLPEAAMGAVTANPWFGVCRNPRLPDRHAGGSSGGSAAAVAAGMAWAALGTDTMGSVRIPAGWCGIAGWKPTPGLAPTQGLLPLSRHLDTVGVLAGSTTQVRAAAEAAGFLGRSHAADESPLLRVPADLVGRAEPRIQDAFWDTLALIGWSNETVQLGLDPADVRRAGLLAVEAEAYLFYREALHSNPEGFSPRLRSMLEYADRAPAWKLERAYQTLERVAERLSDLLVADHHLLALPTTVRPPLPIEEPETPDLGDLTAFVNGGGACAVSVPALSVPEGPVGLQLVGRSGADGFLLAAGEEAERRTGTGGRVQR